MGRAREVLKIERYDSLVVEREKPWRRQFRDQWSCDNHLQVLGTKTVRRGDDRHQPQRAVKIRHLERYVRFTAIVHQDRSAEEIDELHDFRQTFGRRRRGIATKSELAFPAPPRSHSTSVHCVREVDESDPWHARA